MDEKLITVTSPLLPDLDEFNDLLKQIVAYLTQMKIV